jgi:hypothetical protein
MTSLQARLAVPLVLAAVALAAPQQTFAADLGPGPPPPPSEPLRQWTLSITPYGWLPFLQGDVTVKGRSVDIDVNPFELLDHLDAVPFMAYSEARKGPLALYNDIFFAKVGVDASVTRAVRGLTVGASADLDADTPSSRPAAPLKLPDGLTEAASEANQFLRPIPPSTSWREPDIGTRTWTLNLV